MRYNKNVIRTFILTFIFSLPISSKTEIENANDHGQQEILSQSKQIQPDINNQVIIDQGNLKPQPKLEDLIKGGSIKKSGLAQIKKAKTIDRAMEMKLKKIKEMLNPNAACDATVIRAFGVKSKTYDEPTPALASERAYCRRNHNTCCSAANFEKLTQTFNDNAKKFLRAFQPIEELLTLFKGKAYQGFYEKVMRNKECESITKDIIDPTGESDVYFFEKYTQMKLDDAASLLNDIEMFLKRELWFYANLMCSACNPNENPFFILKQGKAEIKALMNTCSDVMEGFEYELRLADLYNTFFKIYADLIKCNNGIKADQEPKIEPINQEKLDLLDMKFQTCLNNFKDTELACQEICSKKLSTYVPNIEFFTPYRIALSLIYHQFVDDSQIEDYYHNTYQKNFPTSDPTDVRFFSETTEEWKEYKMENIIWTFADDGINLYNAQMSKRFIKVNTATIY